MKARITKAITEYLGEEPEAIHIKADPQVSGVYAIRASVEGGPVDFLFNAFEADQAEADWLVLEEVEFTAWPPVSGSPRFFI